MDKLEVLAKRMTDKNPSALRDIMESHFLRGEIEVKEGKITKFNITQKNHKETK